MTDTKLLLIITFLTFFSESLSNEIEDTIVVQWNKVAMEAANAVGLPPQIIYRTAAILHTSMYNAWVSYDSKAVNAQVSTFSRQPESERTYANKHAAVSYAAYYTLKTLIPTQQSLFDDLMHKHGYDTSTILSDSSTAAGVGTLAAQDLLTLRQNDGSNQLGNLNPSNKPFSEPILMPGYTPYEYVNTVDTLNDINYWQPQKKPDGTSQEYSTPHWGFITPFALTSGSQFRPSNGPKTKKDGEAFIAQARQIYEIDKSLTEKQKLIARFWDGEIFPNPSSWNRIAQEISQRDQNSLDDDVKMFFAMASALFDASIAVFDIKLVFNSVRPVTLINHYIDKDWTPLLPTSPHPDFIAGHTATSASAGEALKRFLDNDRYGGSYTDEATGITLSWDTFSDAIDEAGMSRMYAGIHFEDATVVGKEVGRKVGGVVWEKVKGLIEGKA